MRVLFFYPNLYGMNTLPPALGTFIAILKNDGHQVALFDTTSYEGLFDSIDTDRQKADNLNARKFDDSLLKKNAKHSDPLLDFENIITSFKPDLIAMSVTEDTYPVGIELLKALRVKRPLVVAGGVFPTFAPDLALNYSGGTIDYVLKGEGDVSLPELCRKLASNSDISDIAGLYFNNSGKIVNNPLPKPTDLSTLPLPDYSLFEDSRFYRPMQGMLRRMIPVTTIRGCPYTCAYCNSPWQVQLHKGEGFQFFRKRPIALIKDEIEHVITHYGADSIYFWADTFLAWKDSEFEEFCEMYSDFKLPFWIQTRPETVREERFKKLADIGLLRVAFGVEHGNDEFRYKTLGRRVKNSEIIKNLNIVTGLGIPISVNNIIGFPFETRELAFDTIELNRHFKSDGVNAYSFTPFHGTPLRKISEEAGFFEKGKLARCINKPTILNMPQFSKDEIEGIRRCFVLYAKMPKSRYSDIKHAEALTPAGNKVWEELKAECLAHYMHYGDYDKADDIGTVDFENEKSSKIIGNEK